jgi:hypothetical protein
MREDMFKVIVERPRLVNSNGYSRDGRRFRNREEVGSFLGMKRGYDSTKWLNENLAPLRRYLASQVNRPWRPTVERSWCAARDPERRYSYQPQSIGAELYGDATWYAVSKRQLSLKELRKHGLAS